METSDQISFLQMEVIWRDEDMVELNVSASNTAFSGKTDLYIIPADLLRFASVLEGFPDGRQSLFYEEGGSGNHGYFSMKYYQIGFNGHVGVEITIERNLGSERREERDKVKLELAVLPAEIDEFQKQLFHLANTESGAVVLYGR